MAGNNNSSGQEQKGGGGNVRMSTKAEMSKMSKKQLKCQHILGNVYDTQQGKVSLKMIQTVPNVSVHRPGSLFQVQLCV